MYLGYAYPKYRYPSYAPWCTPAGVAAEVLYIPQPREVPQLEKPFTLVLCRTPWERFWWQSPPPSHLVALPDSFQRALTKFENQDAYDTEELRQWLQQLPTRLKLHGVPPDSEQGVAAVATLFSGGLLRWQEKVARAAPDKKETARYDSISTLAAYILSAFVSTDRQGDAFKNMNNLHQGWQSLPAYHLKVTKA